MRRALDTLYAACSALAVLMTAAIAILVLVQMGSRLFLIVVPGVDDFAGYALAAAAFLALGPALKAGAHVRVSLIVHQLGDRWGPRVDAVAAATGAIVAGYFAWASADFIYDSYRFNEVSTGMVATPLWVPRLCMPVGLAVMSIAFLDELHAVAFSGRRLHH